MNEAKFLSDIIPIFDYAVSDLIVNDLNDDKNNSPLAIYFLGQVRRALADRYYSISKEKYADDVPKAPPIKKGKP